MSKISHDMIAFGNLFEELVLPSQVVYVELFGLAHWMGVLLVVYELVLESMDCPTDVSGESAKVVAI
jgi:hypothetical protein